MQSQGALTKEPALLSGIRRPSVERPVQNSGSEVFTVAVVAKRLRQISRRPAPVVASRPVSARDER